MAHRRWAWWRLLAPYLHMDVIRKHPELADEGIAVAGRLARAYSGVGETDNGHGVRKTPLVLPQKPLQLPARVGHGDRGAIHAIEHEQDMGRRRRRATRHRLKRCDLFWLLIIEQGKILLLQPRDRVAGCIGHKNIQD